MFYIFSKTLETIRHVRQPSKRRGFGITRHGRGGVEPIESKPVYANGKIKGKGVFLGGATGLQVDGRQDTP